MKTIKFFFLIFLNLLIKIRQIKNIGSINYFYGITSFKFDSVI